jgi:hypothetical protein
VSQQTYVAQQNILPMPCTGFLLRGRGFFSQSSFSPHAGGIVGLWLKQTWRPGSMRCSNNEGEELQTEGHL